MRIDLVKKTIGVAMVVMLFGYAPLGMAQDKPADNMQILRDKIKADKKLLVATNMELTESEAKAFGRSTSSTRRNCKGSINASSSCWKATRTTPAVSR
jgi:hypothetical protein